MEIKLPEDTKRCIICGLKTHITFVKNPDERSLRKIIETAKSRKSSGVFGRHSKFINCLGNSDASGLKGRIFHKTCYNLFCFHQMSPNITCESIETSYLTDGLIMETTNSSQIYSTDCLTETSTDNNADQCS